ncbi:potassium channel family protein [Ferrimonas marina]|uniref:Voltage-gated potassium channel n=1 Tax=Ferrimonas marina TaxID=299255 RepID=A0A1M5ZFC0_9GAMM|nr:potassium channel family protein [Ferrimonas marina]SHI22940.1 voltage-gated potassium channel [Ferrimonas marina]
MKESLTPPGTLSPKELGFMLLSILSVAVVLVIAFSDPGRETTRVLVRIDLVICIIFISNFFFDLFRADDRRHYLRTHWIDLVASIPVAEHLRFARIFQVLRVVRMIRVSQSMLMPLLRQRQETTLTSLMLAMVVIISLASVLILLVEDGASGANITTAEQAIWWALITISTVGYGDYYPITSAGRVIATVLIVTGVSFFGVVAGYLASLFVGQDSEESEGRLQSLESQQQELLTEIKALRKQLAKRHGPDS